MDIKEVYEKYKHLDHLLLDLDWLPEGLVGQILFDCWRAIRADEYPQSMEIECCPQCRSANIKCRGAVTNCEDCGHVWKSTPASMPISSDDIAAMLPDSD